MLEILLGFLALVLVFFMGMFIAMMRQYGTGVVDTFNSILEAIQEIKAHKAARKIHGS